MQSKDPSAEKERERERERAKRMPNVLKYRFRRHS